ncbi:hypothetical protein [Aliiglaciecola lipolytica]|uniref:hypothetical protein n=1 Tax=Aliiglaciecola lipolytica TaxID=477689 RepID=UPI001C08D7F5|nr:hypothetical protein [Aliiglaciecola lipolytica]MBU2877715.1 hypothetical protein [Aliiglaciecola lipolytica]
MFKKKYYRISELSRNTEIHLEDYEYIVENFKEDLYAKVYDQPVVIISANSLFSDQNLSDLPNDWDELARQAEVLESNSVTTYTGLTVGRYSGLIRLVKNSKKDILRNQNITTCHVILDELKGLKFSSNIYPFDTYLPNEVLTNWDSHEYAELPISGLESFLITSTFGQLQKCYRKFTLQDLIVTDHQTEHVKQLLIAHEEPPIPTEVAIESARETGHEIKRDFNFEFDVPIGNDFNQLLCMMLKDDLAISAKAAWAVLEREVATDEGDRDYDNYNILRSISATEVCWTSRYGNDDYFQFPSMGPTLTRLRKKVKKQLNFN